ncbi:MAG: FAD-dependent oxidoreductase, partial [Planctomycetota bacterium]
METEHTIVVGGGIIGVSAAYYLARRGHRVTLIERGDIGRGSSYGNAGIVAFGHPPIPRPGLVAKTLRWMLDSSSPLYIP